MPSYYNPNVFYPASTYQNSWAGNPYQQMAQPVPQQSFAAMDDLVMKWVDGEVGAKAFQMPSGWPANKPIPLWDSTDTNIFLKSWSPMGFPNPIQKLHYVMQEQQSQASLPSGQNGEASNMSGASMPDMSQYVTKDDLNQMKQELRSMMTNQNGSNNSGNSGNNGNRGGNR